MDDNKTDSEEFNMKEYLDQNNEIELLYGTINKNEIPVIMNESPIFMYSRFSMFISLILLCLIITMFYVIKRYNNKKKLNEVTSLLLTKEANQKINNCEIVERLNHDLITIPYVKYIDISLPVDNFPSNLTIDCFKNIFKFYIITKNKDMLEISSKWRKIDNMYFARFILPEFTELYGINIYISPDLSYSKKLTSTFKVIDLKLRNKNDDIIWKDILIMDLLSKDISRGIIQQNYITVQFDLENYS